MNPKKLSESEYEIYIYDWIDLHDDYFVGSVKIDREADEGSDVSYWMFYPAGEIKPMNCGDLRRISEFLSELNASEEE